MRLKCDWRQCVQSHFLELTCFDRKTKGICLVTWEFLDIYALLGPFFTKVTHSRSQESKK